MQVQRRASENISQSADELIFGEVRVDSETASCRPIAGLARGRLRRAASVRIERRGAKLDLRAGATDAGGRLRAGRRILCPLLDRGRGERGRGSSAAQPKGARAPFFILLAVRVFPAIVLRGGVFRGPADVRYVRIAGGCRAVRESWARRGRRAMLGGRFRHQFIHGGASAPPAWRCSRQYGSADQRRLPAACPHVSSRPA